MLKRLSAISSLFLVFAISGCGLFADYELKIKEIPKDTTDGYTVEVEVKKKGETDLLKEGDGAELKVTISVKCGDADAEEFSENTTRGEGIAKIKMTKLPGKAKDECTVKATADDAKSHEVTFTRG